MPFVSEISLSNHPSSSSASGILLPTIGNGSIVSIFKDLDNDGYTVQSGDCDDTDPDVYPGVPEFCNNVDDDCDDLVDEEDALDCTTFYKDKDQDGYGVDEDTRCLCSSDIVNKYTAIQGGDPDDLDPSVPDGVIEEPCMFIGDIKATGQTNGASVSTVYFGISTYAETYSSPGLPPDYKVYMLISDEFLEDYRQVGSEYEEWKLTVQIGPSADPDKEGYFPLLSWDPNQFCPPDTNSGRLSLYGVDIEGRRSLLIGNMYDITEYQTKAEDGQYITPSSETYVMNYYIVWSKYVIMEMHFPEGWSMVSLPLIMQNMSVLDIFPDSFVVYGYDKTMGYKRVKQDEELKIGDGYWVLI